jgi:hypothetical protein
MIGGLIHGVLWLAVVGILAIVVVAAIVIGVVRRSTGHAHPGGTSADVRMDRDDTIRS